VPYDDHAFFQQASNIVISSRASAEQTLAAMEDQLAYLADLIDTKRGVPEADRTLWRGWRLGVAAVRGEARTSMRHRAKAHHLLPARALAAEREGRTRAVAELAQILDLGFALLMGELFMLFPSWPGLRSTPTRRRPWCQRRERPQKRRTGSRCRCGPRPHSGGGLVDGDSGPVLDAAAYCPGRQAGELTRSGRVSWRLAGQDGLEPTCLAYCQTGIAAPGKWRQGRDVVAALERACEVCGERE
jgi:hypothetical protein